MVELMRLKYTLSIVLVPMLIRPLYLVTVAKI